jgi:ribosome-associated heat shock protein Hsp15
MSKSSNTQQPDTPSAMQSQRIDKWLWAARFYKTRSLASEAIQKGRVLIDGDKIKPGREIRPGTVLSIRQSYFSKTVKVLSLSARRGPASTAATLYEETQDSIANRERLKEIQQAQPALRRPGLGRPTKRERRQIISFTAKDKS